MSGINDRKFCKRENLIKIYFLGKFAWHLKCWIYGLEFSTRDSLNLGKMQFQTGLFCICRSDWCRIMSEKIGNPVAEGKKNMAAGKNLPVKKSIDLTELIEKVEPKRPPHPQRCRLRFIVMTTILKPCLRTHECRGCRSQKRVRKSRCQ